jgi:hypothetical protein
MSERFRRTLPPHPDLDQQKKLAKELLRAFRAGDSEALERVQNQLPDKKRIALTDARFVLAREYGFASWKDLRGHIEAPSPAEPSGHDAFREAIEKRDAHRVRTLLEQHPELRAAIDDPVFSARIWANAGAAAQLHS